MEPQLKQEISDLLQSHPVVLFMKGSKNFPQCGFSATVVDILREAGVRDFKDINILQRLDLREGMKEHANWPTFPQLYVKGEFVGGCDIVRELFASGELFDVLGTQRPEVKAPAISITPAAQRALAAAAEGEDGALRIEVSPEFRYELALDQPRAGDFELQVEGVKVLIDRQSAARADGMRIDFSESGQGGFRIENPNEPPKVLQIDVKQLQQLLKAGPIELFDVRTDAERAKARIEGAQPLDQEAQRRLEKLDRATPLYFHCHHGGRSQQAAEHYLRQGFKHVHNVIGGIDVWSLEVDPKVPRY